MLDIVNLRKSYGTFEALKGVSFHVNAGEMFGLLGPNGAGKSTLLGILACLHPATSGSVSLAGEPLDLMNLKQRRLIGIGTQDLALYDDLTARENLRFFGKLYGLEKQHLNRRVDEMLELTALTDKADQRAGTFSGGMKRRLNIGIAVIHEPTILYLDEPTTGVDPQSRNHIFEQVKTLNAAGMTVIYTSHYMEEVQALCPRIAIMDHGQIIACATLNELLRTLDDTVTIRVRHGLELLQAALAGLPFKITQSSADTLTMAGPAIGPMVVELLEKLKTVPVEIVDFRTEETNLEKVFLHLTERTLRD